MQGPVELTMLSTAVFLGGVVSGFSGFAFSGPRPAPFSYTYLSPSPQSL